MTLSRYEPARSGAKVGFGAVRFEINAWLANGAASICHAYENVWPKPQFESGSNGVADSRTRSSGATVTLCGSAVTPGTPRPHEVVVTVRNEGGERRPVLSVATTANW